MRYGFWTPVFGGWLRNVADEGMAATWDYMRRLCQRAEQIGYDLTLIAELNLNDIKGIEQPALDAWSTAAALAAVTAAAGADGGGAAELPPAGPVRQAGGQHRPHLRRTAGAERRLVLVGGGGEELRPAVRPARRPLCAHVRMAEGGRRPLARADGSASRASAIALEDAICEPKPAKQPVIYAGGESRGRQDDDRHPVRRLCHARRRGRGDRREDRRHDGAPRAAGRPPMIFGMAAYAIVRDSEAEARARGRRGSPRSIRAAARLRQLRPVAVGDPARARAEASRNTRSPTAACGPA